MARVTLIPREVAAKGDDRSVGFAAGLDRGRDLAVAVSSHVLLRGMTVGLHGPLA